MKREQIGLAFGVLENLPTILFLALWKGGFGLEVALTVSLPGLDQAQAEQLVNKAHEVCPYSNATRGNIDVSLNVQV